MRNFWKDLSVTKKLYAVFGLMGLLIAAELLTLSFSMDTLSSVRAFVEGEGIWSKAQKNAILSLYRYGHSGDEKFYQDFQAQLSIPLGDRRARLELLKSDYQMKEIRAGFLQGQINDHDIPGLVRLIRRFERVSYVADAIKIWTKADELLFEVIRIAPMLHDEIESNGPSSKSALVLMHEVDWLNKELTALEIQFSSTLSAGSRWLERMLMVLLVIAVLCIEGTGLFLTFFFARNLNTSLKEIIGATDKVGKGDLPHQVPVRSKDELGQLASAINRMITALKLSIGEKNKAENANQVKTVFLANMSHEIRTPLGTILGLADLLKQPDLSIEERGRYVDIISQTGQNLTRIINDVLDISRVESGYLDIEKTEFSLSEFIAEIQQILDIQADRRNNALKFTRVDHVPKFIRTDKVRLRQILLNICGNALKFTEHGTVAVTYWTNDRKLFIRVSDTGIGIPSEEFGRLFKIFSQVDATSSRKFSGSGLGLALSKKLANALGGDVSLVSSHLGSGSVFEISISYEVVLQTQQTQEAHLENRQKSDLTNIVGKNILVVDDSFENQMLLKAVLTRKGLLVLCASNGREGLRFALENNPDLILMDVQMPIMDGYTATKELRRHGFKKPIIALTAHAMLEEKDRCLDAGCTDYFTKPINFELLLGAISKYVAQRPHESDRHAGQLST